MTLDALAARAAAGDALTFAEILWASENCPTADLLAAAEKITRARAPREYDLCSIQNAKSGRCSGDCKWCAQSANHPCEIDVYDLVDEKSVLKNLDHAEQKKIAKFALVTSGETLSAPDFSRILELYRALNASAENVELCGSLGLLDYEQFVQLREAGMKNYHCNLEASPSFFTKVCTTHSFADKLRTLNAARSAGLKLCCGGIIGMGENETQRVELAWEVAKLAPPSIPLNVLEAIPGTPLENQPPLSDDELLRTVAIFRFANPSAHLRLAGGRAQFSADTISAAMRAGINAAITEGLLTTSTRATAEQDHAAFARWYRAPEVG